MNKEQKEWWWKLGVSIIGATATYVVANKYPFRDDDKSNSIKVLGQSKAEAVKAAASKFNLSEAEIRRSLR